MEGAGKLKPKQLAPKPPRTDAKRYLKDAAKELHKPVRHKFHVRKVFAKHKAQTWSMDLADMNTWKDETDGVTFVLTIADVHTMASCATATNQSR